MKTRDDRVTIIRAIDGTEILVDPEDFGKLSGPRWYITRSGHQQYARTDSGRVSMHRVVLGLGPHRPHVDHINGNGLDNRKENLRTCNEQQNQANQQPRLGTISRFKGVSPQRSRKGRCSTWRAYIRVRGERVWLGSHKTEEDAARAYDKAAREHFGEFARTNFTND